MRTVTDIEIVAQVAMLAVSRSAMTTSRFVTCVCMCVCVCVFCIFVFVCVCVCVSNPGSFQKRHDDQSVRDMCVCVCVCVYVCV